MVPHDVIWQDWAEQRHTYSCSQNDRVCHSVISSTVRREPVRTKSVLVNCVCGLRENYYVSGRIW